MNLENIYGKINEAMNRKNLSRKNLFNDVSKLGMGLLASAVPFAAAVNNNAFGKSKGLSETSGLTIVDILNFALTLEYLERDFYQQALISGGLIPGGDRTVFHR